MRTSKLAILSLLFSVVTASAAFAADDGNTKPRLSSGATNYYTGTQDIIATTSGSGNVKGVSCNIYSSTYPPSGGIVSFTVNGGTAQTIDVVTPAVVDANGDRHTGWIPMNLRFTSSIRVQVQIYSGDIDCSVSWALD